MIPWRIRSGQYARALVKPDTLCEAVALWLRGWRPLDSVCAGPWWTKPNSNQRKLEDQS